MSVGTDVYERVHEGIVEVLCLSCLKLDPKTSTAYTFNTANNESHPSFVLDNISEGIVFLHFSEDACPGCDIMLPIIQDLFSLSFDKNDMISEQITFNGHTMTYFYINIDHATQLRSDSLEIYDQRHIKGLPMFTIVTLGYDKGIIRPYYTSLYGTLGLNSDHARHQYMETVINEAMTIWSENRPGYTP
jgi:hypothetical protein